MTDPITTTIGAVQGLAEVSESLGVLERLKRKLMKQPDVASQKLEVVLIELEKVFGALTNSVNDYMALWLEPSEENVNHKEEVAKLRRFASGAHQEGMRSAKGDCGKIWNIYSAYLRPWFGRVLNKDEADHLFSLFRELSEVDSIMVDAINETSRWLTAEAGAVKALVDSGSYEEADRRIQGAWVAWQPAAAAIRDSLNQLFDLRASFISSSGAT